MPHKKRVLIAVEKRKVFDYRDRRLQKSPETDGEKEVAVKGYSRTQNKKPGLFERLRRRKSNPEIDHVDDFARSLER